MSDEGSVRAALTNAGYAVFEDAFDAGILRVFIPGDSPHATIDETTGRKRARLVGIVVIREGRITYAEHRRRVFAFHRDRNHLALRHQLLQHIKGSPA